MSTYTSYDFQESLKQCPGAEPDKLKRVIAAWGNVDRDGACCDACGGEWSGGFLIEMKANGYAYVSGWCDYTGWGCQDGASVKFYDIKPALTELEDIPADKWDIDPADLNRWLDEGGKYDD